MRGRVICVCRERAFSLIEIMVAVGLLAVIIVGLVLAFNQVQRAFRSGTSQSDVMEGGRAAMSVVTRDLQETSAFSEQLVTNFFAYRSYPETKLLLPSNDERANWLCDMFFLAKRSDDYAIIAYRVDATNELIGSLMRFETNVARTNVAFILKTNILNWVGAFPNSSFHRVAGNVIHFQVVAYDTNGVAFGPTNNFNTNFLAHATLGDVYQFSDNALPAYVDVEMAVMEPNTAERLRIRAERNAQEGADYLRQRAGRVDVFRQRVPIRPAATSVRPPS